jgi:hypothetical protein
VVTEYDERLVFGRLEAVYAEIGWLPPAERWRGGLAVGAGHAPSP